MALTSGDYEAQAEPIAVADDPNGRRAAIQSNSLEASPSYS